MLKKGESLLAEVMAFNSQDLNAIEQFRIRLLGKKGEITLLFTQFKEVPNADKKAFGQELNNLKTQAIEKINLLMDLYFL